MAHRAPTGRTPSQFSFPATPTSGYLSTTAPTFHSGLSLADAKSTWDSLKLAINEIREGNASKLRFEELYRSAYMLVLHKHGEMLYLGVQSTLTEQLLRVRAELDTAANDRLLDLLLTAFNSHVTVLSSVRDILMFMDKRFCAPNKLVPVYDLGLLLFRDQVLRAGSLHNRVKSLVFASIERERDGGLADRALLKSILQMFVAVNVHSLELYQLDFEREFLTQTRSFYQQESQQFFANNSCPDYLRRVEQRIREEESRADSYLHPSSRGKLMAAVYDELIVKYARMIVDDDKSGARVMMKQKHEDDLARLYSLFHHCHRHTITHTHSNSHNTNDRRNSTNDSTSNGDARNELAPLDLLRECMSSLVKQDGAALLNDRDHRADPSLFVSSCLSLRATFTRIVEHCFHSDRAFIRALKDSLEHFFNTDTRSAHFLAQYLDEFLRKESKTLSENDSDVKLNSVIALFRLLHDKDVFEDCYKQALAHRLLSTTALNINQELERSFIAKLKAECGHQYTSRLEGMMKDVELSKGMQKSYTDYCQSSTAPQCELSVSVLTQGFWPVGSANTSEVVLPRVAQSSIQHFTAYYQSIHSGRRLAWQPSLGSAELRVEFDSGRKELIVHSYQMVVLMLFNDRPTFTYDEIANITKIPHAELQRQLLSLAHPSVRVLKKSPNTKAIEPNHSFEFNVGYTSPFYRVKIPLLGKGASTGASADNCEDAAQADAGQSLPASVLEARKHGIEAAVVRIMKARKSLTHSALCSEVAKQLSARFAVDATFVKKRIESLIEREYLARDSKDRRLYHYLA